ncbi:hypothetical protein [Xanthomonas phage RTH11]|nr:hypothetical protein [Xanthomonas phage RTH11]
MSDDHQDPELSGMRFYSIGQAANNKRLTDGNGRPDRTLEVTPVEQLGQLDGELVSLPFQSEVSGERADGSSYTSKVTLNTALTATWLPMGSNRVTPPDVRRGERVIIWRYKDTDQFYWTETGWDEHLRRLETVHYRWSATPEPGADMTAGTNYYHLMVSTHEGMIHLETSEANKEKATFVLQLNTKDGHIALTDNHGNFLDWNCIDKIISLQNGDGTLMQLNKEIAYMYAKDTIYLKAEEKILLETKDFLLETQTGQVNASTRFGIKTPTFEVESDTNFFKTPNTTFGGNVAVGQSLTAAGSGGSVTFNGAATFTQQATFQSPVQLAGGTTTATLSGPNGRI